MIKPLILIGLAALTQRGHNKSASLILAFLWLASEFKTQRQQEKIESLLRRQVKLSKLLREEILSGTNQSHSDSNHRYHRPNAHRSSRQPAPDWLN